MTDMRFDNVDDRQSRDASTAAATASINIVGRRKADAPGDATSRGVEDLAEPGRVAARRFAADPVRDLTDVGHWSRIPHGEPYSVSRSRNGCASKASGPSTPAPCQAAAGEQLARHHWVDGGLPDDGLRTVFAHRPLVVDDVVEVGRLRLTVFAEAGDVGARAGLAAHLVAEGCRVGKTRGHDVAWRDLDSPDPNLLRAVEPELVQDLEDADELVAEPVLEGDAVGVDPPRDEQHLFVLDIDAFDRPDALGEVEGFGLTEGFGGEPTAGLFPHNRRVQALLDRGPDRERRREVVAVDGEVRAITDADFVDVREQVVGRVASENV